MKTAILLPLLLLTKMLLAQPQTPTGLTATGYDHHIELNWDESAEPGLSGYNIYRSENGEGFEFVKFISGTGNRYIDFIGEHDRTLTYAISAENSSAQESGQSSPSTAATFEATDEELLDMVQRYTFRYFYDFAHPVSGLARERNTTNTVTTGGSGFGVMALLVGMERGYITYEQGVDRLLKIVTFLETADRFHGTFPHWMNGATGNTIPFSEFDDGADLVETAFLIQGLLTVRQYVDGDTPDEVALRQKITQIWEAVEWSWFRKGVQNVLYWHWSPNHAWTINLPITGFNEGHIIYILAKASPTFSIPNNVYHQGWADNDYVNGNEYFGYELPLGPYRGGPLFFAHYSYLGFDPRGIKDDYANYFYQNRQHSLVNQAYCIANPQNHEGYSEVSWGLTAGDDPLVGYLAHEPTSARDNGTLTPTAALSSMPYTPGPSMDALKHFYRDLGADLWGEYGFYDGFNLNEDWFATSYLAIDQGPIICMIENHRSELLWDNFMANPEIAPALDALGFVPDTTTIVSTEQPAEDLETRIKIFPNPTIHDIFVETGFATTTTATLEIFDLHGRLLSRERHSFAAGLQTERLDLRGLGAGLYLLRMETELGVFHQKVLLR